MIGARQLQKRARPLPPHRPLLTPPTPSSPLLTTAADDPPLSCDARPCSPHCCPGRARSGWCFAETCWAALTTNFERSLDLGKFTGTKTRLHGNNGVLAECATGARRPPLLPEQFAHELASKTFYNRDHDLPLVSDLYAKVGRRPP